LVELVVDKNTTVVFPAPLMSTIAEVGAFLAREQAPAHDGTLREHQKAGPGSCRDQRNRRSTLAAQRTGR
jgi:hypothetical protein